MKVLAKVISTIATLFTVLVLVAAVVFTGPKLLGFNPFIVESGSMEPVIHTGSVAYINTRDTDVKPGDIVTFRIAGTTSEKLVTHRILREEDGLFITKGDANDVEDMMPVSKEQIVGTYAYSIPKAGYILAKQQKLIPVLVFWVIGLNAFSILAGILANDGEKEEEENAEEKPDIPETSESALDAPTDIAKAERDETVQETVAVPDSGESKN